MITKIIVIFLLATQAFAFNAELLWDPNSEEDLAGYRLYYESNNSLDTYGGIESNEGPSPITIYLEDLEDSNNPTFLFSTDIEGSYILALTAFNINGYESDFSDEVSITFKSEDSVTENPPSPPANFRLGDAS